MILVNLINVTKCTLSCINWAGNINRRCSTKCTGTIYNESSSEIMGYYFQNQYYLISGKYQW